MSARTKIALALAAACLASFLAGFTVDCLVGSRVALFQGFGATKGALVFCLLVAGFLYALAWCWVDRALLSRLARLVGTASKARSPLLSPPESEVLPGGDELASLERDVSLLVAQMNGYRELVENAAEAIILIQDGAIKFANRAAAVHSGYSRAELISRHFLDFVHPDDRQAAEEHRQRVLASDPLLPPFQFRVITKDGETKWAEANSVKLDWEGRKATLHFLTDITPRRILEDELARLTEEKTLILDSLSELVAFLDRDLHVIWANRAAGESVGKDPRALFGAKCYEIWHGRRSPCQGCPVVQAIATGQPSSGEIASPDGRVWRINAAPVKDKAGKVVGAVETVLEITERRRYEERLRYLSLHDSLTGLYNRAFFQEELHRLGSGRDYPITVLVADLDGLKLVNDVLGHAKGDEMLIACARLLKGALRRSDILARIGGDEFAALLPRTDQKTGESIAQRIRTAADKYNRRENPELPLHVSVGWATCRDGEEPLEETLRHADEAMYQQKLLNRTTARNAIIGTLVDSLKRKEPWAETSLEELKEMVREMGKTLGLSEQQMADLVLLAQIHDLGLVSVADEILVKPQRLQKEEWEIIRRHPEKGYRIALSSPDLARVADLILRHHERWDGGGYPLGLRQEEIPIECRVWAILDAFDAMTSGRPYRQPKSEEDALAELERHAGSQFDPHLVTIFTSLVH
jgi:diguanylate cyclase (GGDEF)-like protein/PAS domain S-box-containing protein